MGGFEGRDLTSVRDLSRGDMEEVFAAADRLAEMEPARRRELARGRSLGYLFFEPSTRTRLSFEAAMASLGGTSLGIADAASSSARKGESLRDMVRMMSIYSDALVLRHPRDGSSRFAAEVSDRPVINGGSGTEEHPTQALQDLYTMRTEAGRIDGLTVGVVGDLKYGRTVYSLLQALCPYDVRVRLVSPEPLRIRPDAAYDLRGRLDLEESRDIASVVGELDVVYVTRIQQERFPDAEEYLKVRGSYVIGREALRGMKEGAIIMHPLPRVDEIPTDVDSSPRARYFAQAEHGLRVRAALLALILGAGPA